MTAPDNADADLAAIEAGIDEWKAGDDGLPVDEAFAEIRGSERSLSQWFGKQDSDASRQRPDGAKVAISLRRDEPA